MIVSNSQRQRIAAQSPDDHPRQLRTNVRFNLFAPVCLVLNMSLKRQHLDNGRGPSAAEKRAVRFKLAQAALTPEQLAEQVLQNRTASKAPIVECTAYELKMA